MAGFLPPGVFFRDDAYFYEGQIGGGRNTRIGGNVVAGVKQRTFINFATPIWVTPVEVLGGNLAFSLTVPLGEPAVRANAVLTGPVRANPRVRTASPEAHVAPSTTLYREAFSKLETRDSGYPSGEGRGEVRGIGRDRRYAQAA
jgi:hypothetical protein